MVCDVCGDGVVGDFLAYGSCGACSVVGLDCVGDGAGELDVVFGGFVEVEGYDGCVFEGHVLCESCLDVAVCAFECSGCGSFLGVGAEDGECYGGGFEVWCDVDVDDCDEAAAWVFEFLCYDAADDVFHLAGDAEESDFCHGSEDFRVASGEFGVACHRDEVGDG